MVAFKLGCRPGRMLRGQPHLTCASFMRSQPPAALPRLNVSPAPMLLGNNVLGDCVPAGTINHARATAALAGFMIDATTDDAVQAYRAMSNYDPADPLSDRGCVVSIALTTASRRGVRMGYQTLFPIWGSSPSLGRRDIANIIASLTAAGCAFDLALDDQDAGPHTVLDYNGSTSPSAQPGSWGRHFALLFSYEGLRDTDRVDMLSWGMRFSVTWRWVASRIVEVHGMAWRQLQARTPAGLPEGDWDSLVEANRMYLSG